MRICEKRSKVCKTRYEPEVINRVKVNGNIEVGRHPGVVPVSFLVPKKLIERHEFWIRLKNITEIRWRLHYESKSSAGVETEDFIKHFFLNVAT
ncbi:hypothetical protein [Rhodohalobacter sp.]|uniref:hypothetical protein n=1 Tax=Rhodohalobacter sp. TaxID=1974210 RepID=UPI00356B3272